VYQSFDKWKRDDQSPPHPQVAFELLRKKMVVFAKFNSRQDAPVSGLVFFFTVTCEIKIKIFDGALLD